MAHHTTVTTPPSEQSTQMNDTEHVGDCQKSTFVVRPRFENLPLKSHHPKYSAWGLWGEEDQIGTLNLLTPETVATAAKEIKDGLRFSLNWPLNMPVTPGFGRSKFPFVHTIHSSDSEVLAFDDSLTFNTQRSSQWDGLRHFAFQKEQLFYQGVTKSQIGAKDSSVLGLQLWHGEGGIAGRGVLLDFWAYAQATKAEYNPIYGSRIEFSALMACLKHQEDITGHPIRFIPGDILIIRCGYTDQYLHLDRETEVAHGVRPEPLTCGIEQDERMLKWLWDHQFAAVAGDSQSFECFPPNPAAGFLYHEVLLAGWGCPIAEMLWLEELSQACELKKKYTFFVSSSPLNVYGGVASPANMMAIL